MGSRRRDRNRRREMENEQLRWMQWQQYFTDFNAQRCASCPLVQAFMQGQAPGATGNPAGGPAGAGGTGGQAGGGGSSIEELIKGLGGVGGLAGGGGNWGPVLGLLLNRMNQSKGRQGAPGPGMPPMGGPGPGMPPGAIPGAGMPPGHIPPPPPWFQGGDYPPPGRPAARGEDKRDGGT